MLAESELPTSNLVAKHLSDFFGCGPTQKPQEAIGLGNSRRAGEYVGGRGREFHFFILIGWVCEIGGGWLVWQWLREGRGLPWGFIGGLVLILYGIIPTFQPAHFGRVYAAYGGFFIGLSLLWGWILDGNVPDRFDLIGAVVSLLGVSIIMYWPRS